MKANTLSHHPDFDTGNSMNEHLIVLLWDRFKGMPEDVLQLYCSTGTNSSPIITALDPEPKDPSTLDQQVKNAKSNNFPEAL